MDHLEAQVPDLLLTRLQLPDMSGAMFCNWLAEMYPKLPVIVVSSTANLEYVDELVTCGIHGYLTLKHSETHLQPAIHQAFQGGAYFSEDVLRMLIKELPGPDRFQPKREAYSLNRAHHQELLANVARLNRLHEAGASKLTRVQEEQRELVGFLQTENT